VGGRSFTGGRKKSAARLATRNLYLGMKVKLKERDQLPLSWDKRVGFRRLTQRGKRLNEKLSRGQTRNRALKLPLCRYLGPYGRILENAHGRPWKPSWKGGKKAWALQTLERGKARGGTHEPYPSERDQIPLSSKPPSPTKGEIWGSGSSSERDPKLGWGKASREGGFQSRSPQQDQERENRKEERGLAKGIIRVRTHIEDISAEAGAKRNKISRTKLGGEGSKENLSSIGCARLFVGLTWGLDEES